MTTEQNYVGKADYANSSVQTVESDRKASFTWDNRDKPELAVAGAEFTPKLFQIPLTASAALNHQGWSLSVLLEALFCYQARLNDLPKNYHSASLTETVDSLIAKTLDEAQTLITHSLSNSEEGGMSRA